MKDDWLMFQNTMSEIANVVKAVLIFVFFYQSFLIILLF